MQSPSHGAWHTSFMSAHARSCAPDLSGWKRAFTTQSSWEKQNQWQQDVSLSVCPTIHPSVCPPREILRNWLM